LHGTTFFLKLMFTYDKKSTPVWKNYFGPTRTVYPNLGQSDICKCMECGDQFFWADHVGLFPRCHRQIYNRPECDNILLSYQGQFVVSAARIRGISISIYRNLWQAFIKEDSSAHQLDSIHGRPDSMSTPDFGLRLKGCGKYFCSAQIRTLRGHALLRRAGGG
jgi:hypothetical protein